MPTSITFPERHVTHCFPCEHHKCIGSFHVRCGGGGYRDYDCTHPDANDFGLLPDDPRLAGKVGELLARLKGEGRHIGKTELQPDWCPLRRENNQGGKV